LLERIEQAGAPRGNRRANIVSIFFVLLDRFGDSLAIDSKHLGDSSVRGATVP